MGQLLHSRATTTEAVRRAIQSSQASIRTLAQQYGINPKTVAKWKKRTTVADAPMGPTAPQSTVLSQEEEAIIVAFRKHTLLPLDDCLYGVQERERILQEARRQPDPAQDGTATWSLATLQRTLRQAADGLPHVSTYTIWATLHDAGLSWQQSRTWCDTGQVKRRRKSGVVTVTDPDMEAKKR